MTSKTVDVIEKCIGSFGKWHIIMYILLSLTKFPLGWNLLNIIFLAPPMDFYCSNPINATKCSASCTEYVYDNSTFASTITTEWNLVCSKQYLESLSQTLTMLATLLGNTLGGLLSDKFGRKHCIIWAGILQAVSGVAIAYSPWFVMFLILRTLSSLATGVYMITGFVFITEIIGREWRSTFGTLYHLPFSLSQSLMALISYYLRDWREFQIAIAAPSLIFIIYYWIIPESPRWQLAVSRETLAVIKLQEIAKFNKLPTSNIESDVKSYLSVKTQNVATPKSLTILDLFKTKTLRTYTIILYVQWSLCSMAFYGSNQFTGQLGGDIFLNVAIAGLIQVPGLIAGALLVKFWGRKNTNVLAALISATSLLAVAVIPAELTWLRSLLSSIGISTNLMSFATLYIQSGEIFPTILRNTGVGSCSTIARIGSMLAPFIVIINPNWIPPTIFGVGMLINGILGFKLPETINSELPETVEDVEKL